jgi:hypothetical protein
VPVQLTRPGQEDKNLRQDARPLLGEFLGGQDAGAVQLGELLEPADGFFLQAPPSHTR